MNQAFNFPLRVYYEDTDAGGVVYHSQYLNFMERARTEALRSLGFEQDTLKEQHGILFVVHRIEVDFKKPARFNDVLQVQSIVKSIGRSLLVFQQTIHRQTACSQTNSSQDELLIQAVVNVVCISAQQFKPLSIPELIKQKIQPFVLTE